MSEVRGKEHWQQRYIDGDLPWDTGVPEERLMEVVRGLELPGRTALDMGCGAGTNAIELARMGFEVTGIDISEKAVEMARQRAADAGVDGVRFEVASIVEGLPVEPGSIAVATDRGCFHGIAPAERSLYIAHLAEALSEGGWWVVLAACCEEVREPGQPGPPQIRAEELIAAAEPLFEVWRVERGTITGVVGGRDRTAWRGVFRKR